MSCAAVGGRWVWVPLGWPCPQTLQGSSPRRWEAQVCIRGGAQERRQLLPRHEPASGTAMRGNMLSLSVVEASLWPEAPELVLPDVIVDDEVVEPMESRHGSPGKPFARKSFVMRAVKGEGWLKPCLLSGGPSEESKLASSTVGDGGIICNCRRGKGRRRPEPL